MSIPIVQEKGVQGEFASPSNVGCLGDREIADLRQEVAAIETQFEKGKLPALAGLIATIAGFVLAVVGLSFLNPLMVIGGLALMGIGIYGIVRCPRSLHPKAKDALKALETPDFTAFLQKHGIALSSKTLIASYRCFMMQKSMEKKKQILIDAGSDIFAGWEATFEGWQNKINNQIAAIQDPNFQPKKEDNIRSLVRFSLNREEGRRDLFEQDLRPSAVTQFGTGIVKSIFPQD